MKSHPCSPDGCATELVPRVWAQSSTKGPRPGPSLPLLDIWQKSRPSPKSSSGFLLAKVGKKPREGGAEEKGAWESDVTPAPATPPLPARRWGRAEGQWGDLEPPRAPKETDLGLPKWVLLQHRAVAAQEIPRLKPQSSLCTRGAGLVPAPIRLLRL